MTAVIRAWLVICGLLTTCHTQAEQTNGRPDAEAFKRLAAELDGIRQHNQVPAMGLAMFDEGRPIIVAGYGSATADTPFRWGSITKSFTGLAGLTLTRTSEVQLQTPIRAVLGEGYYENEWASGHPVRFQDLLALSAGFADLTRAEWNDNTPLPLWQALERYQSKRRTLWPPGLQHSYSNVPPGLTAAVIERASGMTFETFLSRYLFKPLGMHDASLSPVARLPGGFRADGQTAIPYWHVTFSGFGALNASTREMSRFVTALLNNGRLSTDQALPAELVDAFFTPRATLGSAAGLEVGYGAGVYGWVRHGHLFHGHGGDADGYRSRYGLLRAHGRGYLLVINTDNPKLLGRLTRRLEAFLVDDLSAHPVPDPAADDLGALTGIFYPASARFGHDAWRRGDAETALLQTDGGRLLFSRGARSESLIPTGDGRFRRSGDPAVTVIFRRDPAGHLFLQGELGNFVRISPGACPDFLQTCD